MRSLFSRDDRPRIGTRDDETSWISPLGYASRLLLVYWDSNEKAKGLYGSMDVNLQSTMEFEACDESNPATDLFLVKKTNFF